MTSGIRGPAPARGEHVLLFGGGEEMPGLLRTRYPGTRTSVLCGMRLVQKLRDIGGHSCVVGMSPRSEDADWVAVAAAVHARHPVTRIGAFGEFDQDRAAAVGAALGIATHSPRTTRLVRDKERMRRHLTEAGVEHTPARVVEDVAQVREFAEAHGYPVILKPVAGTGSLGVARATCSADADAAFVRAAGHHEVTSGQAVLVERFYPGPQFSVEGFAEDGEHVMVAVTRKFSDPDRFIEVGHLLPAPLDEASYEAITGHARAVLTALGVSFGPTHTEVVLSPEGPRVIETHLRLAGDDIPSLVRDALGIDLVDHQLRQVMGERVLPTLRREVKGAMARPATAAIWFVEAQRRGEFLDLRGLDAARARPGVRAVEQLAAPGTRLDGLAGSFARLAAVRVTGPDAVTAVRRARETAASLTVVVGLPGDTATDPI